MRPGLIVKIFEGELQLEFCTPKAQRDHKKLTNSVLKELVPLLGARNIRPIDGLLLTMRMEDWTEFKKFEAAKRLHWEFLYDDKPSPPVIKLAAQLPDLEDSPLTLTWDFEKQGDDCFTVIRHGEREIWREPALYGGTDRFADIIGILCAKYGARLADVVPSPASESYLYGVNPVAPDLVKGMRAELRRSQKFWDFSADRSVSRLREESVVGNYYEYRGHIQSTVKLPGNRRWSGTARRVAFTISGDEISSISWEGGFGGLEEVYREAKRILGELRFRAHDLEGWYRRVRGGKEDTPFSIKDEAGNPEIHVAVRGHWKKKWIKTFWAVLIDMAWKEAGR